MAGEEDSVSFVSASACHIGGPNSVNPGQILLVYGKRDPTALLRNFSMLRRGGFELEKDLLTLCVLFLDCCMEGGLPFRSAAVGSVTVSVDNIVTLLILDKARSGH